MVLRDTARIGFSVTSLQDMNKPDDNTRNERGKPCVAATVLGAFLSGSSNINVLVISS